MVKGILTQARSSTRSNMSKDVDSLLVDLSLVELSVHPVQMAVGIIKIEQ